MGLLLGTYTGYVLRPGLNGFGMYGKLSLFEILTYVSGEVPTIFSNSYVASVAVASVHYMIIGALLGMVLGWVLGKNTKRN